jgi:hypothetical protein
MCCRPTFLAQVFAQYHGRSYEDTLTFARFVDLIGEALLEPEGSGRQSFTRAQEHGTLATSQEAVYGKLRRVPLSLSLGFLTEGTARLRTVLPPQHLATALPASVGEFTVIVGDGKTRNRVAKRLLPARGAAGKIYGGKLLVAFLPSPGGAVALSGVGILRGQRQLYRYSQGVINGGTRPGLRFKAALREATLID